MSWFFAAIPYLLAIGTITLGAFEIIKDWNDYKESRLKMAVAAVFIVVAALSLSFSPLSQRRGLGYGLIAPTGLVCTPIIAPFGEWPPSLASKYNVSAKRWQ